MKFIYFYTILLIFIEAIWKITCSADFNNLELDHLSKKLEPGECMKLLEAIYGRNPSYVVKDEKDSLEFRNQPGYCRIKLDEWNRTFQGTQNEARSDMESSLRSLGRPDLANYIKRSRRFVDILNNVIHKKQKSNSLERRDTKASEAAQAPFKRRKTRNHKKSLMPPSAGHALLKAHFPVQGASRQNPHHQDLKKQLVAQANAQKEPKEIALQEYGGMKAEVVDKSPLEPHPSIEATSPTRWIAFGIFLLVILTTVLITALVALYKHGRFPWGSPKSAKTCDDRCPLTDHFQKLSDVEHGWTSSTDYMGTRWRRGSSVPSSRSPSLNCLKEKKKRTRRIKRPRDKTRLDKKRKTKEAKAKKKKKPGDKKTNELSLRERIVNILRKDKGDCKCCRCPFGEDGNHQVCTDDHCKERRIVNLTDLCSSPRKKSPKSPKKSKKPPKSPKSPKSPKKSKQKEPKSSLESSPRERRESRFKETLSRMKERSPRWSLDHHDHIEPCNRMTCDARRSPRDRNSVDFDETALRDHEKQKK